MVHLEIMTRDQCHELYRAWENDPAIYMDMSLYKPYVYSSESVDRYYNAKQEPTRVLFAIIAECKVVGELQLKNIDYETKECTISIHLQNNSVKGMGYGTKAEIIALDYAFNILKMNAVNADVVLKNERSQYVLQKVGFALINEDDKFRYYRIERSMQDGRAGTLQSQRPADVQFGGF